MKCSNRVAQRASNTKVGYAVDELVAKLLIVWSPRRDQQLHVTLDFRVGEVGDVEESGDATGGELSEFAHHGRLVLCPCQLVGSLKVRVPESMGEGHFSEHGLVSGVNLVTVVR